mgnify:CR=1 FL=1
MSAQVTPVLEPLVVADLEADLLELLGLEALDDAHDGQVAGPRHRGDQGPPPDHPGPGPPSGAMWGAPGPPPRLSAAVLATTLVPTTLGGHRFWEVDDSTSRSQPKLSDKILKKN